MKERPILFSAPMVLAILAGRKTQTRRVVKPQPQPGQSIRWHGAWFQWTQHGANLGPVTPYAETGDRLWVRETTIITPKRWTSDWALFDKESRRTDDDGDMRAVRYLATRPRREGANVYELKATPSIFMPRWASRITLEVTGVRVERLQDISEEDARAEGVARLHGRDVPAAMGGGVETWTNYEEEDNWHTSARASFGSLWRSINGADSWKANPWVWVVEFKRVPQ